MFLKKITSIDLLKRVVRKLWKDQDAYEFLIDFVKETRLDKALDINGRRRCASVMSQRSETIDKLNDWPDTDAKASILRNEEQRAVRLLEYVVLPVYVVSYPDVDEVPVIRFFTEDEIAMGDENED